FSATGISGGIDKAAFLGERGAGFLTVGTDALLCPDQPEEVFAEKLAQALAAPLPVLACNGFIRPAHLRCVGPQANHDEVLAWADIALGRLRRVNGKFMVFGSGGARRIPDGWPRDKAEEQFVALLKRMGPLAENHGVTVVVEQLQASECNFINRIGHAASLIRAAGHPHIRLLADLYHMARTGDTPDDLKNAMDVVAHMEIAEKEKRTYPGIKGDDFRPFFRVLKQGGYRGAISIEGKGDDSQVAAAFREIAKQAAEA
ncbi:MAG: sugar phosphate isomerase/epimerase, partial [Akkermansiaceae bacterium]|nr:sugar phosphate isomerase/epimerase [Akkermansiaceae bacterium]